MPGRRTAMRMLKGTLRPKHQLHRFATGSLAVGGLTQPGVHQVLRRARGQRSGSGVGAPPERSRRSETLSTSNGWIWVSGGRCRAMICCGRRIANCKPWWGFARRHGTALTGARPSAAVPAPADLVGRPLDVTEGETAGLCAMPARISHCQRGFLCE